MQKVIVIRNVYHLMSRTSLMGKEGEVVSTDPFKSTIRVKFAPGTSRGSPSSPVWDLKFEDVVPAEQYPVYQNAVAKLTSEERMVLRV